MKGKLYLFNLGGLLALAILLSHGLALAYGSSSAMLEVSTVILPELPPAVVQTLNANKEILSVDEMHPSEALEKLRVISMTEETKGGAGKIKVILVTFN